jgi:lipoate-protein ligase A
LKQAPPANNWLVIDSGPLDGERQMEIDRSALANVPPNPVPLLRFFEWTEPTVTYGYLLDPLKVKEWALAQGIKKIVQRPTGGGTVLHRPQDLALSLLWPRRSGDLPHRPREAYALIHTIIKDALDLSSLYLQANCGGRAPSLFTVCFSVPVCDDVMVDGKKIVGGALRLTRDAVLYQGDIHLDDGADKTNLKRRIEFGFTGRNIPA